MRQQLGGVVVVDDEDQAIHNLVTLFQSEKYAFDKNIIDFDAISRWLKSDKWRAFSLECATGEQIGALLIKNAEGHIGIFEQYRGKWSMRQSMEALCDFFNVTRTYVQFDKPRAKNFLARHGWTYVGVDKFGWRFERGGK